VSAVTTQFLDWCCTRLAARGRTALLLVWDNASWHVSKRVHAWIRAHNRAVKRGEAVVRIVTCYLPIRSPWLNPIEAKWRHGKRWIVEPARLLTADEIAAQVCACFGSVHEPHLHSAAVLPFDDVDVDGLLDLLAAPMPDGDPGFIIRYEVGGVRYVQVTNFAKHQTPHIREAASVIPAPDVHQVNGVVNVVPAPDIHQTSTVQTPGEHHARPS
jgi:transposase